MEALPSDILGYIGGLAGSAFSHVTKSMESTLSNSDTFWQTKIAAELGIKFSNMKELFVALESANAKEPSLSYTAENITVDTLNAYPWKRSNIGLSHKTINLDIVTLTKTDRITFDTHDTSLVMLRTFVANMEKNDSYSFTLSYDYPNESRCGFSDNTGPQGKALFIFKAETRYASTSTQFYLKTSEMIRIFNEIIQLIENKQTQTQIHMQTHQKDENVLESSNQLQELVINSDAFWKLRIEDECQIHFSDMRELYNLLNKIYLPQISLRKIDKASRSEPYEWIHMTRIFFSTPVKTDEITFIDQHTGLANFITKMEQGEVCYMNLDQNKHGISSMKMNNQGMFVASCTIQSARVTVQLPKNQRPELLRVLRNVL